MDSRTAGNAACVGSSEAVRFGGEPRAPARGRLVKGIMAGAKTGDELEVDLAGGTVKNLATDAVLHFRPYPEFILGILEAGGLYPQIREEAKAGKYA